MPPLQRIFHCSRHAYTLVELAIVLVILGLMVGGTLAGQSLIHASLLRTIPSDLSTYGTAVNAFRTKYLAIPGDMTNATQFWGFQGTTAAPNCVSQSGITAVTATGTCDGNGDTQVARGTAAGATETFQFWRQLVLAGLATGTYSGVSLSAGRDATIGTNVPKSKMPQIGYSIEYWGTQTDTTGGVMWSGIYNNIIIVGGQMGTCCPTEKPVMKPEDVWNIDTKMDDGNPSKGTVRTFYRNSYVASPCTTSNDESNTAYNMSNKNPVCNIAYTTKF